MKDKKITILQILIIIMIIMSILVAIILVVSNNFFTESEVGQVNLKNETKEEAVPKPTFVPNSTSKNEDYIHNATDEEKIQRGEELFGDEKCGLSEYIVQKLKDGEWNQGADYKDGVHNNESVQCDIMDFHCRICGEKITSRSVRFKICIMCKMCEHN